MEESGDTVRFVPSGPLTEGELAQVMKRIQTRVVHALVKQGYLTDSEGTCLKEIYDYNPLLFDFVLKRTSKHPQTSRRLPASVFMTNPALSV
jgi:hypothetical protein